MVVLKGTMFLNVIASLEIQKAYLRGQSGRVLDKELGINPCFLSRLRHSHD